MQKTVQRQNVQIEQLERQIVQLTSKSDEDPHQGKAVLYRSCEELRSADPESGSGGYWIDPDGVSTGDPPIFVQCNMATGSSRFIHCNVLN